MVDHHIDFSTCLPVNHLWPALVQRLGSMKAQQAVRQALDLQNMQGHAATLPILLMETCGIALINVDLFRDQTGFHVHQDPVVLLVSLRDKQLQLLRQV